MYNVIIGLTKMISSAPKNTVEKSKWNSKNNFQAIYWKSGKTKQKTKIIK